MYYVCVFYLNMKNKYWIKLYVKENMIDNLLFRVERVGEARIIGYIISTMNIHENTWVYDKTKGLAIMRLCNLKEASVFNYLKLLCTKKILIKKRKGLYALGDEYLEYGSKVKKQAQ
jgi:hypothetical protein